MVDNNFTAAMTEEELLFGEARHRSEEPSRRLAMAAGLTKSSDELAQAWQQDPNLYLAALSGAIVAYDENKDIQDLLLGCIVRLASVVEDGENEVVRRAMEIIAAGALGQAS